MKPMTQGRKAMITKPLTAALRDVRNDLNQICSDFDCIEAHLKCPYRMLCPYLSDLDSHVDDLDRHLSEIAISCIPLFTAAFVSR